MKRKLRGSTLVELLVVMIISTLVFIGINDSMLIFGRYSASVASKLNDNGEFCDNYYKMETLARLADSAQQIGDFVVFYSMGRNTASIYVADSIMVCGIGELADTTFRRVVSTKLTDNSICDTLSVTVLKHDNTRLKLDFSINQPIETLQKQTIIELEKKYEYE